VPVADAIFTASAVVLQPVTAWRDTGRREIIFKE
jgi:hypothetical protein